MVIAALFTIAWKRPKYLLTEQWMMYINTMEYYSAMRKKECHWQQHGWT